MKTNNELIAEFMGMVECDCGGPPEPKHYRYGDRMWEVYSVESLRYHESWDWLMPVVERTHEVSKEMQRKYPDEKELDDSTGWRAWSYLRPGLTTDINDTYKRVVEFIQLYNEHQNENS